ncbi:MAG: hypothetical protein ACO21J_05940 [Anaerohalosphaeraceae bacterium]
MQNEEIWNHGFREMTRKAANGERMIPFLYPSTCKGAKFDLETIFSFGQCHNAPIDLFPTGVRDIDFFLLADKKVNDAGAVSALTCINTSQ